MLDSATQKSGSARGKNRRLEIQFSIWKLAQNGINVLM
jgi:hypothetical protein